MQTLGKNTRGNADSPDINQSKSFKKMNLSSKDVELRTQLMLSHKVDSFTSMSMIPSADFAKGRSLTRTETFEKRVKRSYSNCNQEIFKEESEGLEPSACDEPMDEPLTGRKEVDFQFGLSPQKDSGDFPQFNNLFVSKKKIASSIDLSLNNIEEDGLVLNSPKVLDSNSHMSLYKISDQCSLNRRPVHQSTEGHQ